MKLKLLEIDPYLKPFEGDLRLRMDRYNEKKAQILDKGETFDSFANGYLYYGLHRNKNGWTYREWAPNAEKVALIGEFNNWDSEKHQLKKLENGNWEINIDGYDTLKVGQEIKVRITANGGNSFDRIPSYMNRVGQSWTDGSYSGLIWEDDFKWGDGEFFKKAKIKKPLIYECHIGMANEEENIGTYNEFAEKILPRIKKDGYNCIQIMAIMEHPYYASFGYQVTNFFAVSSRFGTPEELKKLIDKAHSMGIAVLLDIIHSHAAKNTLEGLSEFDGTDYQYFHSGGKGIHPAWDTRLFNYGKNEVIHFLLSNIKYWIEVYHFDGFRFDGVTSMLYLNHGLGINFDNYKKYFDMNTDLEAITYLQFANELIKEVNPNSITIAEDMSGMPGMCIPIEYGGIGFDYRLAMGVPDFWINTLKSRDEDWNIDRMWHELTSRRPQEKNIGYCESHDQALVGDKTIMFWLADKEMYWCMDKDNQSQIIARAMDYHKIIRLVTSTLAGEGYLNFMGNEFGHPEWIDFPREGNNDSHKYAKRQWSLVDNKDLKYQYLQNFDNAMIKLLTDFPIFESIPELIKIHNDNKILVYKKGELYFVFNFHTWITQAIDLPISGKYNVVLDSNIKDFGGKGEKIDFIEGCKKITLPPRCAVVLTK